MRIACLWVPELPLVAVPRAEPSLVSTMLARGQPAAGDAKGVLSSRLRLVGAAGAEGVVAGQTLAEAQALCPELRVRLASPERGRAAAQAAGDAAASVTPRLEEAAPGLVFPRQGGPARGQACSQAGGARGGGGRAPAPHPRGRGRRRAAGGASGRAARVP